MQNVIIVGAGGHAAEIDEYIQTINHKGAEPLFSVVGFLDDNPASYDAYRFSAPFLGRISGHVPDGSSLYLIGIASPAYRRPIIEALLSKGAKFASLVHPNTFVSPTAKIGQGVIIAPNVNIGPNVVIGDFTMVNARASIAHDTKLGVFNFIGPNVCFSGFTTIGDDNLFGINSATIPSVTIGNRNKIAAGMVLDKPVGDDTTVFYRYKERVMAVPKGKSG